MRNCICIAYVWVWVCVLECSGWRVILTRKSPPEVKLDILHVYICRWLCCVWVFDLELDFMCVWVYRLFEHDVVIFECFSLTFSTLQSVMVVVFIVACLCIQSRAFVMRINKPITVFLKAYSTTHTYIHVHCNSFRVVFWALSNDFFLCWIMRTIVWAKLHSSLRSVYTLTHTHTLRREHKK